MEPADVERESEYSEYAVGGDSIYDTSNLACDEDGNPIEQGPRDYDSDDSEELVQLRREDLPPASEEQENIINLISHHHVLVDSVAGCGKTTTVIHTALRYPEKKMLILMYNKRLKEETKKKIKGLSLPNVEVQNFHSFYVRHYEGESFTDVGLSHVLSRNMPPKVPYHYDIIIVDEAQDLKLIFFRSLCKIIHDQLEGGAEPHIMILGDKFQNVYKFLGSDERFLLHAPRIFTMPGIAPVEWREAQLSISYRLTRQTASFINHCALGYERIRAIKDGPVVQYIICNLFSHPSKIVAAMIEKYGYENIFIVSNSVRSAKSPLRHIANNLSKQKIPIFVPQSDDADIDEKVIKGKLVFTTYNQTKGLERECVMVFNVDEWNPHKGDDTPNAVYVAMTRAKTQLILFHSNKSNYANFIRRKEIPKYGNLTIMGKYKPEELASRPERDSVPVGQLIEYLSGDVIDKACSYFSTRSATDDCATINIPTTVIEGELHEEVSDITGVMIPAYYEFVTTGQTQIYVHMDFKHRSIVKEPVNRIGAGTPDGIARLLHMANVYISADSGYVHKLAQISKYDWVKPQDLEMLTPRLRKHVGSTENMYEYKVHTITSIHGKHIAGSIDCVSKTRDGTGYRIYEFKCVSTLKRTHLIQLAIYAYLLEKGMLMDKYEEIGALPRKYLLLNLLTGKYYRLVFELENLEKMVQFLVLTKFIIKSEKPDSQFFSECLSMVEEYL